MDEDKFLALVDGWKKECIRLLVNGKSFEEISFELRTLGYDISPRQVKNFSSNVRKSMVENEKMGICSDYLLNSIERAAEELEEINKRTHSLLERFERENNSFLQLVVLKELREQVRLAIMRIDGCRSNIVNVKNLNVTTGQEIVDKFRKMQLASFDAMDATYENGMLTYRKPSQELIDAYNRYRAMKLGIIKAGDGNYVEGVVSFAEQ